MRMRRMMRMMRMRMNTYLRAGGTVGLSAGQSVFLHGPVLHEALTVCARVHHQLFPCLLTQPQGIFIKLSFNQFSLIEVKHLSGNM